MGKIKIKREYYFDPIVDEMTWKEVKEQCKAKDDYILEMSIGFVYYEEETDEEYKNRIERDERVKKLVEKIEYEHYLELKKKYENDNTRND